MIESGMDPETAQNIGSFILKSDDPNRQGTLAEAYVKCDPVMEAINDMNVEAQETGESITQIMATDRMFKRALVKDEQTGDFVRAASPEEVKKNY